MQHHDPFESPSDRTTNRAIPCIGVAAAGLLVAGLTWMAGPDRPGGGTGPGDAAAYARDQAAQTITVMGYHSVVGLVQDAGGSWRAEAQKNGAHWRLEISPYGAMNAHTLHPEDTIPAGIRPVAASE